MKTWVSILWRGKAWANIPSQLTAWASASSALLSGVRDTKVGHLALNLVAKRLRLGWPHQLNIRWAICTARRPNVGQRLTGRVDILPYTPCWQANQATWKFLSHLPGLASMWIVYSSSPVRQQLVATTPLFVLIALCYVKLSRLLAATLLGSKGWVSCKAIGQQREDLWTSNFQKCLTHPQKGFFFFNLQHIGPVGQNAQLAFAFIASKALWSWKWGEGQIVIWIKRTLKPLYLIQIWM